MKCLRCGAPMYQVTEGSAPPKATCSVCCQYVDCAKCSKCGDVKCVPCYNKSLGAKPKLSPPIIKQEEDF